MVKNTRKLLHAYDGEDGGNVWGYIGVVSGLARLNSSVPRHNFTARHTTVLTLHNVTAAWTAW